MSSGQAIDDSEDGWSTESEEARDVLRKNGNQIKKHVKAFRKAIMGSDWVPSSDESDADDSGPSLFSGRDYKEMRDGIEKRRRLARNECSAYVQQREGGIYTFPLELAESDYTGGASLPRTTSICTTGALTCVGVYIPIDQRRCFAAHIDASTYKDLEMRDASVWNVPDDLLASYKELVVQSLDRTFKNDRQAVKTLRKRKDLKDSAIIVCTWPVVGQQKATGGHIIDVLCDYFQLDKAKTVDRYARNHGFIVDHDVPHIVKMLGKAYCTGFVKVIRCYPHRIAKKHVIRHPLSP